MSVKGQIAKMGFTMVPNWVLDKAMLSVDPIAFRVYLYALRQTVGWGKPYVFRSLEKIQKGTGLDDGSLLQALETLAEDQYLTISVNEQGTFRVEVNLDRAPPPVHQDTTLQEPSGGTPFFKDIFKDIFKRNFKETPNKGVQESCTQDTSTPGPEQKKPGGPGDLSLRESPLQKETVPWATQRAHIIAKVWRRVSKLEKPPSEQELSVWLNKQVSDCWLNVEAPDLLVKILADCLEEVMGLAVDQGRPLHSWSNVFRSKWYSHFQEYGLPRARSLIAGRNNGR